MRNIFLVLIIILISKSYSQDKLTDSINSNWEKIGKFTFLGNQSSYSYCTAGGQSSVSGTVKIDYDLNRTSTFDCIVTHIGSVAAQSPHSTGASSELMGCRGIYQG